MRDAQYHIKSVSHDIPCGLIVSYRKPYLCMDSYEVARRSLAHNIRIRRKALGLSQEALALEADVNRTFVSQIERSIGNPSLHTLCRLSRRLGMECHELLLPTSESPALPAVFHDT